VSSRRLESAPRIRLRRFLAASAAIAACLVAGAVAAPSAKAGQGIGALRICSNCVATGGNLARYDYVVLQAWEYARIPALKAANPNIKVLVYKNLPSTSSNATTNGIDNALLPAGVGYAVANANHPDWFLLDTNGQRIQWSDYPGNWQMDPGNAGYQNEWLTNVRSELQRNGWDGVMLDDTTTGENEAWHIGSRVMAKYPTAASYTAATRSFLANVCPALRSAGFLALPNIGSTTPAIWTDWVTLCSGAVQEYWTKWGYNNDQQFSGADWDARQQFLSLTEQANRIFLGVTYAPMSDVRSMRYARASFLLDWDGGPSALAFGPNPDSQDPYSPEWSVNIGQPLGARYKVGNAWRRDYSGGTVLVDPSPSAAQTVSLGSEYSLPDGSKVSSVTLQAVSGLVLRSTGSVARPPPPPTPPSPPPASPPPPASRPQPPSPQPPAAAKKKKRPQVHSSARLMLANRQSAVRVSIGFHRRLVGRVTVAWSPGLGISPVSLRLPGARVSILAESGEGWKVVSRTRTNAAGAFRSWRSPKGRKLRAVVRAGSLSGYSRVLVVG
jgi:hypothetical protein